MKTYHHSFLRVFCLIIVLATTVLCSKNTLLRITTKQGKNPEIVSNEEITNLLKETYQLGGSINTSSLRKEIKHIVTRQVAETLYTELKDYYGDAMSLREVPAPGMENVSRTLYPAPFSFKIVHPETGEKKKIKAKFRIRTYYSRKQSSKEYGERAPITGNNRFIEIKIDHMNYEDVVIKRRLLLPDNDILTLLDGNKFKAESKEVFTRIRKEILAGNSRNDMKLVDYYEKLLKRIHALEDTPSLLKPYVEIEYVRHAYRIQLTDKEGKTIDLQVTIDNRVTYLDPETGQILGSYPADATVFEVKIPLSRVNLSDNDINEVPGLEQIKLLLQKLSQNKHSVFKEPAGKFSNFPKFVEK